MHKGYTNNLKGESDSNTIIEGDFTTPLTSVKRLSRQKVKRDTSGQMNTLGSTGISGLSEQGLLWVRRTGFSLQSMSSRLHRLRQLWRMDWTHRSTRNLPRPETEPVFPTLAGRFS